jgi:hypothetical protein
MLTEVVHKLVRGNYFVKVYIFYGEFKYTFTACNLFPVTYIRNVHTKIYSELLRRNSPMMLKPNNCLKYKINHSCKF